MSDKRRNIGKEILNGIRELKRGTYGRIVNAHKKTGVARIERSEIRGKKVPSS